jgi:antitoxin CptB
MIALPVDSNLARIRWRCRRGMRELDTLLMRYAEQEFVNAAAHHRIAFEGLLNLQDPEILDLLTGRVVPDDQATRDVVQRLLTHT